MPIVDESCPGCEGCGFPCGDFVEAFHCGALYVIRRRAADLLSVEADTLVNAMSFRRIKAGQEWFTVYSDSKSCHRLRGALCKSIYSGLFDWLVKKVRVIPMLVRAIPAISCSFFAGSPEVFSCLWQPWVRGSRIVQGRGSERKVSGAVRVFGMPRIWKMVVEVVECERAALKSFLFLYSAV